MSILRTLNHWVRLLNALSALARGSVVKRAVRRRGYRAVRRAVK